MASPVPPAHCGACDFSWNSPAMVEGLRLIGSCPRCGKAELHFRDVQPEIGEMGEVAQHDAGIVPPHLVLGLPRR